MALKFFDVTPAYHCKLAACAHAPYRRYPIPEGQVDTRPLQDLPEDSSVQITGIWNYGWVNAVVRGMEIPLTHMEVGNEVYLSLIAKHGDQTINCQDCDGGHKDVEEDGRHYRDPCYACGASGRITVEQYNSKRLFGMAEVLGDRIVGKMRKAANSDPDGEGWDFGAAENMMRPYEYTQARVYEQAERVSKLFARLRDEGYGSLIDSIAEFVVPFDNTVYMPSQHQFKFAEKKIMAMVHEQPDQPSGFPNLAMNVGTTAPCPKCNKVLTARDCKWKHDGYYHCPSCDEKLWQEEIPF